MAAGGLNWDIQLFACLMPGFYEVMIERNFSSAHQLRGYKGKCENLHGHNYKVEIFARGEELNPSAENIARYFVEYLNGRVGDERVKVYKVRCYETPTSVATYQIDV